MYLSLLCLTLALGEATSSTFEPPSIMLERLIKENKPFYTQMNFSSAEGTYEGANKLIVDLNQHARNLELLKERAGASDLWATVKADAYGLGWQAILVNSILSGHVTGIGTAHIQEAKAIVDLTPDLDFPIMVYAASTIDDMYLGVSLADRVIPWVSNEQIDVYEEAAKATKTKVRVILVTNTGMNRYGVEMQENIDEAVSQGKRIQASQYLELFAVTTHFPVSDSPRGSGVISGGNITDEALTLKQIKLLLALKDALGVPFSMANSGATLQYPETYDAADGFIRPGLIQYGLCPNQDQIPGACKALGVQPVFHIQTQVTNLHRVYPGETVCYGRKYTCCGGAPSRLVATVPIGYGDGIRGWADNPNSLDGAGVFSINGTYYPIAGKRSMDSVMLLVDESVQLYDTVKIHFPEKDFRANVDRVMPDFRYTSITLLSQRITRQYVFENDAEVMTKSPLFLEEIAAEEIAATQDLGHEDDGNSVMAILQKIAFWLAILTVGVCIGLRTQTVRKGENESLLQNNRATLA